MVRLPPSRAVTFGPQRAASTPNVSMHVFIPTCVLAATRSESRAELDTECDELLQPTRPDAHVSAT